MADGKAHYRYWKKGWRLAVLAAVVAGAVLRDPIAFVAVLSGYAIGRWVDPDLDLIGLNSAEARMMDDFKVVGVAFVAYWMFYAYFMRFIGIGRKGHRNFFSHFPGVSTAIRLAYILLIPAVVAWYYSLPVQIWTLYIAIEVWLGLTIADAIHFYKDIRRRRR